MSKCVSPLVPERNDGRQMIVRFNLKRGIPAGQFRKRAFHAFDDVVSLPVDLIAARILRPRVTSKRSIDSWCPHHHGAGNRRAFRTCSMLFAIRHQLDAVEVHVAGFVDRMDIPLAGAESIVTSRESAPAEVERLPVLPHIDRDARCERAGRIHR
jgi:hypothetical protein